MRARVLYVGSSFPEYPRRIAEILGAEFEVTAIDDARPDTYRELQGADYVLTTSALDARAVRQLRHARFIHVVGRGEEKVNRSAAGQVGVPILTTGPANALSVAEHVLMVMLALLRNVVNAHNQLVAGAWPRSEAVNTARELHGKTVGLVGVGNIGRRVATLLTPFNVTLLHHRRSAAPSLGDTATLGESRDLPSLLRQSDIISLQVPLTPDTLGLIGASELAIMKQDSLLVNVSRGRVIDEPALVAALRRGAIGGAALDVFAAEPLPSGHPFLRMKNVVLTPHTAGITREGSERALAIACAAILNAERPNRRGAR